VTLLDTIGSAIVGLVGRSDTARLSPVDIAYASRTERIANDRDAAYELYEDYYLGRQDDPRLITFGDRKASTRAERIFGATHNVCALCIDVLIERMAVAGFATGNTAIDTMLAQAWAHSRMDEHQNTVHGQAFVKGDSYVLVGFDAAANLPMYTYHDALTMMPVYDGYHQMTAAYKTWAEPQIDSSGIVRYRRRLTKFTPALIEKFAQEPDETAWKLWTDDRDSNGNPDGGVIDWRTEDGRPLGIPIVPFRNRPRGADFGHSELSDLIPLQDEYARRIWYTSETMSYQGAGQVYVSNVETPLDPVTRQPKALIVSPGAVWQLKAMIPTNPVVVGQLTAGNVLACQDAADRELKTIAAVMRVPLHLIWPEGGLPSGEALKTAESGLVAKVDDRAVTFGNAWEDVCRLAIRLSNRFGTGAQYDKAAAIETRWHPFETRSALTTEQELALSADDLSWPERMRRRGFTADQITAMREELEADGTAAPGDAALGAVDAEGGRLRGLAALLPGNQSG